MIEPNPLRQLLERAHAHVDSTVRLFSDELDDDDRADCVSLRDELKKAIEKCPETVDNAVCEHGVSVSEKDQHGTPLCERCPVSEKQAVHCEACWQEDFTQVAQTGHTCAKTTTIADVARFLRTAQLVVYSGGVFSASHEELGEWATVLENTGCTNLKCGELLARVHAEHVQTQAKLARCIQDNVDLQVRVGELLREVEILRGGMKENG